MRFSALKNPITSTVFSFLFFKVVFKLHVCIHQKSLKICYLIQSKLHYKKKFLETQYTRDTCLLIVPPEKHRNKMKSHYFPHWRTYSNIYLFTSTKQYEYSSKIIKFLKHVTEIELLNIKLFYRLSLFPRAKFWRAGSRS